MKNKAFEKIKYLFLSSLFIFSLLDAYAASSAISIAKGADFIDTRTIFGGSTKAAFVETRDYTTSASSLFVETIDTATPIFTLIIVR